MPDPARMPSGYREYAESDSERLTFIKTAQRLGLTLNEISEIIAFRDRGEQPCGYVAAVLRRQVADLDRRIVEMGQLRDELRELESKAAAPGQEAGGYCSVIEHARLAPNYAY